MRHLQAVHASKRAARGFTLVELLVVISIIALLIAILLPSLKKAREGAKRAKCMANVRSIAQAALTYATDDSKEFVIPIGIANLYPDAYTAFYGWGGRAGKGNEDLNALDGSIWGGGQLMAASQRPLNETLYKGGIKASPPNPTPADVLEDSELNLDVYQCPGDMKWPGMHMLGYKNANRERGRSSYDYFGTSYSANCFMVSLPNKPLESNSPFMRPLSRIPNPTNTVLFLENAGRYASYANNNRANGGDYEQSGDCFWPYPNWGPMTANGYHGADFHFNTTFGDGHASWVKIKGHGMVHYAPGTIPITNRCILHRGLGYQFDTLPASLIRTGKRRSGDLQGHIAPEITDGMSSEFAPAE